MINKEPTNQQKSPEIIATNVSLEAERKVVSDTTAKKTKATIKKPIIPIEKPKKVLIVAAECAPFAKTGGLADVIGTLPQELVGLNIDARVILPFHRIIKNKYSTKTEHITDFYIRLGWRTVYVGIERLVKDSVTYYFIDNEGYFGDNIYRGGTQEIEQYAFFCRAVMESIQQIGFIPEVMHLNDWQTGMIPLLLKTQYNYTSLANIKTVFTIHNIMYQGMCGFEQLEDLLSIPKTFNTPKFVESNGCANFMKTGLVFSDKINTVSPTYAQEIKSPFYSYGMEGILNARAAQTVGIINGIDTTEFDPQNDKYVNHPFSADDLSGKELNKKEVMEKYGLEYKKGRPLIGIVSRLTSQKGFDLIMYVFHNIMRLDVSLLLLGTGDVQYENFFRTCEAHYKGRVCSYIGYDNAVAHEIYASSDLFLMPSKFEPCGISQMISLRYGTIPIVRETGGLKDTVTPFNEFTGEGNGFSFKNYNAHEMLEIVKYALRCMSEDEKRHKLVCNAMNCDNSFRLSAMKYKELYLSLL
ncbi:MAG: glycogen synthase GlgA [Oscillospiraceae bacterium]